MVEARTWKGKQRILRFLTSSCLLLLDPGVIVVDWEGGVVEFGLAELQIAPANPHRTHHGDLKGKDQGLDQEQAFVRRTQQSWRFQCSHIFLLVEQAINLQPEIKENWNNEGMLLIIYFKCSN